MSIRIVWAVTVLFLLQPAAYGQQPAKTSASAIPGGMPPNSTLPESKWSELDSLLDNLEVRVSGTFLTQLVEQPAAENLPFNLNVLGVPFRGTAGQRTRASLVLVPSANRAVLELRFSGTIAARSLGHTRMVGIHSMSTTRYVASKRVLLDAKGIRILPTHCTARTTSTVRGISTGVPGLRGALVRRVARRRASRDTAEANRIVARHVERSVCERLDREATGKLREAAQLVRAQAGRIIDQDLASGRLLTFSTTKDHLYVGLKRRGLTTGKSPPWPSDAVAIAIRSPSTGLTAVSGEFSLGSLLKRSGALAKAFLPLPARVAQAGDSPDPPIAVPKLPRFQPLLSLEQGWLMLRLHSPQALAQSPEATRLRR